MSPVSSPLASHLQRCGYSLAIWAHFATLISHAASLPAFNALLLLSVGWGGVAVFYVSIWPLFMRNVKRRVHAYAVDPPRKTLGSRGAPKRWWDIPWITGPSDELVAPRVRVAAGEVDREMTTTVSRTRPDCDLDLRDAVAAMSR